MKITTSTGIPLEADILINYLNTLVNKFFKIIPIREEGNNENLHSYVESLQLEMIGCKELISELKYDAGYLSLLSILQYLIDNPEITFRSVRREVFNAISICNGLKAKYFSEGGSS